MHGLCYCTRVLYVWLQSRAYFLVFLKYNNFRVQTFVVTLPFDLWPWNFYTTLPSYRCTYCMNLVCLCQIVFDLLKTAFAYPLSENRFSWPCDLDLVTLTLTSLEDQGVVVMHTHTKFGPIPPSRSREIFRTNKQTDKQTDRKTGGKTIPYEKVFFVR